MMKRLFQNIKCTQETGSAVKSSNFRAGNYLVAFIRYLGDDYGDRRDDICQPTAGATQRKGLVPAKLGK